MALCTLSTMDHVLHGLRELLSLHQIEISQLFVHILEHGNSAGATVAEAAFLHNILASTSRLISALYKYQPAVKWIQVREEETYIDELRKLVQKENGWHFGARNATAQKIEDFRIDEMGRDMKGRAPRLWGLLDALMHADSIAQQSGDRTSDELEDDEFFDAMEGLDDEELLGLDTLGADGIESGRDTAGDGDGNNDGDGDGNGDDHGEGTGMTQEDEEGTARQGGGWGGAGKKKKKQRRRASPATIAKRKETIKSVVSTESSAGHRNTHDLVHQRQIIILTILMITVNQQCNAFAAIIGIFLHGHNAPEKVTQILSRIGISISMAAVHQAIKSLSTQASRAIRKLGQSLTVAWAFDNFDVNLKSAKPTVEAAAEASLRHLTSGMLFPLPPGTAKDDLRCSDELWSSSRLNDTLPDNRPGLAPQPSFENLLTLFPEYHSIDDIGMTCRDRFNAWKFLHDLVHNGPTYFHQFRPSLMPPEVIDRVPHGRTPLTPARAMKISNSTVSGNLDAIANLLEQGGVGSTLTATNPADTRDLSTQG